ncbi:hypothetical protein FPHOBKDP_00195 [Listeria phage LPJP1]|nr:hypothetical protein FPHOBKDP_00195 [Listeria phage LPJP1]
MPRYGKNDGTLSGSAKPDISCDLWQYTSTGKLKSYSGSALDLSILNGKKDIKYFTGKASSNKPSTVKPSKPSKPSDSKDTVKTTSYYVTATKLNIRQKPDADSKSLGTLDHNDRVQVISISKGWAKLKSGSKEVYVSEKYISKKAKSNKPKPVTTKTYTVVKGDTLSGIGKKLGKDWKALASKNNIKGPAYVIKPGQKIKY